MRNELPLSALRELAAKLNGAVRYVVGGSTGLALRGASLGRPPRDIDIYVDEAGVDAVHALLGEYAADGPAYDETDRYRSILSHYRIAGAVVEAVGRFRVSAGGSVYETEVDALLHPASESIEIGGAAVPVVPLGHELIFNLLRERADRAAAAGALIAANPERHLSVLLEIASRNRLAPDVVAEVMRLASSLPAEEAPS